MTTTANIIANLQDEAAELQRQLSAAQAAIPANTKRDAECKTADDLRHKAMYYESQCSQCSYGFNKVAGELRSEVNRLEKELAAAQAVIAKLQEALGYGLLWMNGPSEGNDKAMRMGYFALSTPSDDTALRQLLEAQREAAASLCKKSDRYRGDYFAELIRAMPLVIDEARK